VVKKVAQICAISVIFIKLPKENNNDSMGENSLKLVTLPGMNIRKSTSGESSHRSKKSWRMPKGERGR
jgi:hypothetical protein